MSSFIKQLEKEIHQEIIRCSNNKESFLAYWSLNPNKTYVTAHNQIVYPININSLIGGFNNLRNKYHIKTYFK